MSKNKSDTTVMDTNELVRMYSSYVQGIHEKNSYQNTSVEYEVRFGIDQQYTTRTNFEDVFKRLTVNNFKTVANDHLLRISFNGEANRNIRCEIDSLSVIQKYCKINYINDDINYRFVVKKPINDGKRFYVNNMFNYRTGINTEELLSSTDSNVSLIKNTWTSVVQKYRYMKRCSMMCDDLPNIRVDLSMVNRYRGKGIVNFTNTLNQKNKMYNYEIEIEIVDVDPTNMDMKSIIKQLKKTIKIVLTGIQNTNFPIKNEIQHDILDEYFDIISGNHVLQKKIEMQKIEIKREKRGGLFIGPSSHTLQLNQLIESEGEEIQDNILTDYCVTDKADGERRLLYIGMDQKIYLITPNLDVIYTGAYINSKFNKVNGIMLDGEYILYDKYKNYINTFAAFDLYFFKGRDYRANEFISNEVKEDHKLYPRYSVLSSFIRKQLNNPDDPMIMYETQKDKFMIELKEFEFTTPSHSIFQAANNVLEKQNTNTIKYNTDGLIISHMKLGVGMENKNDTVKNYKYSWKKSFKWKPPQYNTIDFLVSLYREKSGKPYLGTKRDGGEIVQYYELHLKVSFDEDALNMLHIEQINNGINRPKMNNLLFCCLSYLDDEKYISKIKKQFINAMIRKISCKNRSELFHMKNRRTTFKLINQ